MATLAQFHGTESEATRLLEAIASTCECYVEEGKVKRVCQAHRMIYTDQRALDGLVFVRRFGARFVAQEFA